MTTVEKKDLKVIFCSKDLRLVPETRAPKEHFKLVFGSGTSSPAKIRPLKVWDLLDFPLGSALWNFASKIKNCQYQSAETAPRGPAPPALAGTGSALTEVRQARVL